MNARMFVDTNVLVCLFDDRSPKKARAGEVLDTLGDAAVFWDALIVEASLARGCSKLLSEDLQHGRAFGNLRIENPFREASR